jgi:hypothetical protein
MFNRTSRFVLLFILVILLNSNVYTQTSRWRVVWKRNPVTEKIVYYVVFRKVNSAPSLVDSVGWKPEPTESTPNNLLYYVDSNISLAEHYYYRVQAVDSFNNRSSLSLAVDAAIPRIVLVDSLSFPVDSTFSINLNQSQYVVDPDNSLSDLSWSVSGGNLIHISINSSNMATISTPSDSTIKETFTFTVADPDSFFDTKSVVVTLRTKPVQPNRPPKILSQPLLTASENTLYQYTVMASDADGDSLTFTLGTAPGFLSLQPINATQARLRGTPSSSDVGDHAVTINVSDRKGGDASQTFTLHVNQNPSITSSPVLIATEDQLYEYNITASDTDGDSLTFTLGTAPGFLSLQPINATQARLRGTPSSSDVGDHAVTINVSDGKGGHASQDFTLQVIGKNNNNPSISSSPVLIATEDQLYEYDITAIDQDGDSLTFTLGTAPGFLSLQPINATQARLKGTPSSSDVGDHAVTINVSDGKGGHASQNFTLHVNQNPSITSSPALVATEDQLYEYNITAIDQDGDSLTFTLATAPGFLSLQPINATQARLKGTPSSSDVGDHAVTINVSDGKGGSASQTFTIHVQGKIAFPGMIVTISITNYGSSIVKISWETRVATKDYIKYGTTGNYDQSTNPETQYSTLHEKVLRELLAETTYHYQIVSEDQNGNNNYSNDSTFVTGELTAVTVFPIPYIEGKSPENESISFTNIPVSSTISIYNLMGELVFHVENINYVYTWKVLNDTGKKVNTGLYIYYIKDKGGKKVTSGKLVIIR